MKNLLNSILILIVFISLLKGSYLGYLIVSTMIPTKQKNNIHTVQHVMDMGKKQIYTPQVFKITPAQAAEPKQPQIPRPVDKLLAKQWERLRAKEAEISRRERQLKELEKKIEKKIQEQKRLAQKIEDLLKKAQVLKDKKIKHLVQVYANMDPARAAQVLEKLDTELAVKILAGMKGRVAGEILTNMDPKRAAQLSEALTAFQTPFGK